uniref:Transmembrane protein 182 n=1 Tax=Oncorhynchus tshawytscha TaxID=74940 RepID=A0AAZ3NM66_ONCTS
MKLSVALFFAGMFGALAAMFVLLSFETDYWFLASETCNKETNGTMGPWASAIEVRNTLSLPISNQPHAKVCTHAYLFPFPVSQQTHNATTYDSAIIYRGFWSIFMLIGVTAVVMGGFFIICAAPFASHRLYKAGGGLFLILLPELTEFTNN